VVSVSLESVRKNAGRWSKEFHVAFPVIYDPEHKIAEAYNVQGIPFNVAIDREGKIVDVFSGARPEVIDAVVAKLASSKS
jgi:thioredoxin-like negative regulator of GroEL